MQFSPAALAALIAYAWPGNVRELLNAVERAAILAEGPEIRPADLPEEVRGAGGDIDVVRSAAQRQLTLAELEREYTLETLRRVGGNKSRAAEALGVPRRTLYRRLKEFGVALVEEEQGDSPV